MGDDAYRSLLVRTGNGSTRPVSRVHVSIAMLELPR